MGWTHPLSRFLGKKPTQKTEKKSAATFIPYGASPARFSPREYKAFAAEGFQRNVIVYRAIRLISQNAAAVPWRVFKGRGNDRTPLDDHPLATLLRRPNPSQSGAELFEALYGFFLIAGNSYLENVAPNDQPPHELWTLRPDRMSIVPGPGNMPAAYRYTVNGSMREFRASPITGQSRILHLKSFHPLDDWYGMSPLDAAAFSVDQHNDAAKWNASLLQSSGRPSGALVYKPASSDSNDTLTDEQRQNIKDELERFFTGPAHAGRPLVLEGGLDWREMSLSPKDMDWLAGKDVSAREIALAFHVPPQLIGVEGSMTFANMEQAQLALYDDAVLPLLSHIRDELNNWLVPFFGDDISIDYDIDSIEALSPRREKIWSRVEGASFMTLNEKRKALNLPPLENGDTLQDKAVLS